MSAENYTETMNTDTATASRREPAAQRTVTIAVPDNRPIGLSILSAAAAIAYGWLIVTAAGLWIPDRWLDGWATALAPVLVSAALAAIAITIRRRRQNRSEARNRA